MALQVHYEKECEEKKQNTSRPDLSKIRKILFWDTSFDKIDWESINAASSNAFLKEVMKKKKMRSKFFMVKNLSTLY
jgi:hypothetical protein